MTYQAQLVELREWVLARVKEDPIFKISDIDDENMSFTIEIGALIIGAAILYDKELAETFWDTFQLGDVIIWGYNDICDNDPIWHAKGDKNGLHEIRIRLAHFIQFARTKREKSTTKS